MSSRTRPTARTLRTLDAATPLTDDQRERAKTVLDQIVATPLDTTAPAPARRGARRARLAVVSTAALALAVGLVVLPGSGGGGDPAYASWTATPTTVSEGDLAAVERVCRRRLSGALMDLDRAELALAERRGDHVVLLYRTDDPDMSGSCLTTVRPGSGRVLEVSASAGGSSGPALPAPPTGLTQGAIAQHRGASITDGAVGTQVVGVTIHAGDLSVQASVRNGRYVAWWPGPAFEDGPVQPSGEGGPEPMLTYDLTLQDGTLLTGVAPTLPR